MGIRGNITRTNLAYANEHRDWRVYEALGHVLIRKARRLHAGDSNGPGLDEIVYAVDSSTIDLCLSMFPWAKFKTTKSAAKRIRNSRFGNRVAWTNQQDLDATRASASAARKGRKAIL